MSDQIHIEKDSVQETLLIPLYARVQCTRLYPELYQDPASEEALKRMDHPAVETKDQNSLSVRFGALEAAMRQYDISAEVKEYLKVHPQAAIVNLGCGLDPMSRNLDNGTCRMYNLDYPDVIAARNEIFPAGEREENIGCDLNDIAWFDRIDADDGIIFYACGVFYYFKTQQVQTLFTAMTRRFPGGCLVFDTAGKAALKMMIKGVVKQAADIDGVDAYFHAGNPEQDIVPWIGSPKVSSRGYMLGYNDLKVPGVSGFFRFLAKVGDGPMKMKITKIEF